MRIISLRASICIGSIQRVLTQCDLFHFFALGLKTAIGVNKNTQLQSCIMNTSCGCPAHTVNLLYYFILSSTPFGEAPECD